MTWPMFWALSGAAILGAVALWVAAPRPAPVPDKASPELCALYRYWSDKAGDHVEGMEALCR